MDKECLFEQDEVYCILNHSVEGRITSKVNHHGMWLYTVEPKEKREFQKWIGVSWMNVKFLHWQLRKKDVSRVKKSKIQKKA